MRHSRTRASRALLIGLAIVLVVGVIVSLLQWNKVRRADAAKVDGAAASSGAAAAPVSASRAESSPGVVTETTTTTTTAPASRVAAKAPKVERPVSDKPLADAESKVSAGKLVQAREVLSAALVAGRLGDADAAAARKKLAEINQTLVFSERRFADDPWGGPYTVKSGDSLARIAAKHNVTAELLQRVNGISDPRRLQAGKTIKVVEGPFHATVSKSAFRMDLYLGSAGGPDAVYVASYPVGLGKDDSTPVGTWRVEPKKKIKNPTYYSPRGEGVFDADDPKNPLGEYWIALEGVGGGAVGKTSYGIHGTIEPQSIGKQASMGCIRMRNEDVALVFEMLIEGKSTVEVRE